MPQPVEPLPSPPSLPGSASPSVSRRRMLAAAGVGAGLAALSPAAASAASAGSPATPATIAPAVAATLTSDLPLVGGPEFPIGIFWPPPPFESTPARYGEIASLGVGFVISGNYADDGYILQRQLGLARDAGLAFLVADDTQILNLCKWFTISDDRSVPMSISTADGRELVSRAVGAYGPYSSLAGFNLFDEPGADRFASLATAMALVREQAPTLLPYLNLLPGNGEGYRAYVTSFVETVHPSVLSFDRYPLLAVGDDAGYFENWAIVRQAALDAGIPAWTYVQTLGFNGHRTPTAAEILWQVNVSLAYSAKGIQYFTYWTPDPARGEGFLPALLTTDGHRTERWNAVRKINTQWLTPVGAQLKPLHPDSVVHAGETPLPSGAIGFAPTEVLESVSGAPFVIGTFSAGDGSATRWLLVVNRSAAAVATGELTLTPSATQVARFAPGTGQYVERPPAAAVPVRLDPGAAVLYRVGR